MGKISTKWRVANRKVDKPCYFCNNHRGFDYFLMTSKEQRDPEGLFESPAIEASGGDGLEASDHRDPTLEERSSGWSHAVPPQRRTHTELQKIAAASREITEKTIET